MKRLLAVAGSVLLSVAIVACVPGAIRTDTPAATIEPATLVPQAPQTPDATRSTAPQTPVAVSTTPPATTPEPTSAPATTAPAPSESASSLTPTTASATPTAMAPTPSATQSTPVASPALWEDFPRDAFARPTTIDNPWLPLKPGTRLVTTGESGLGDERLPHRVELTVTDLTKVVDGIRALVVFEEDFDDGDLVEAELIFYAQDDSGRVWLLGEYPEEYEDGRIDDTPAWLSGVHDARAGILMQVEPRSGTPSYSEGWGPEVDWTDRARVLETGAATCVPLKCFDDVIVIDEYNADVPNADQLKTYARGVGNIRVGWAGSGDDSHEELALVEASQLDAAAMAAVRKTALAMERRAYQHSPKVYGTTPPLEPLPPD
jgi:hypothetical protein